MFNRARALLKIYEKGVLMIFQDLRLETTLKSIEKINSLAKFDYRINRKRIKKHQKIFKNRVINLDQTDQSDS